MCTVLLTKEKVSVHDVYSNEKEREEERREREKERERDKRGRKERGEIATVQVHILQEDMSRGLVHHITCCEVTAIEKISVDHRLPLYCTVVYMIVLYLYSIYIVISPSDHHHYLNGNSVNEKH